jgi:hypothetical protein
MYAFTQQMDTEPFFDKVLQSTLRYKIVYSSPPFGSSYTLYHRWNFNWNHKFIHFFFVKMKRAWQIQKIVPVTIWPDHQTPEWKRKSWRRKGLKSY